MIPQIKYPLLHGANIPLSLELLYNEIDDMRRDVTLDLAASHRSEYGQFLTPVATAKLMSSMFEAPGRSISILDAGAGVGSLFAATVFELCKRHNPPDEIHVTAYEIEPSFSRYLHKTVDICAEICKIQNIKFTSNVIQRDFIQDIVEMNINNLFTENIKTFSLAILNPPYRKINSKTNARILFRSIGIETTNLYTGFVSAAIKILSPNGELITITPRSFCNGTYFRGFRKNFLSQMQLKRIHLFDSRLDTFKEDTVLQETIIVHSIKTRKENDSVVVSTSGSGDGKINSHTIKYSEVVLPTDSEQFIRIIPNDSNGRIVERMNQFKTSLSDLGLTVSTGKVIDFRARSYIHLDQSNDRIPLIYPQNVKNGTIVWPILGNKHQYLDHVSQTSNIVIPNDHFVLVKRFSSKEQQRRVMAAVIERQQFPGSHIGLENHLNYFHADGKGLD